MSYAHLFENFENILEPKECELIGEVPRYLSGTMVRNGPGMFEIGDSKYHHWFDGLAYMQRYSFADGKMFYSARFLESECYKLNTSKNRILMGSFGTLQYPDPCKTIFQRFFSYFFPDKENDTRHDNANVFFTPVGDQLFACTETPHMLRIDPETLETKEAVDFSKLVTLHTCTAHHCIDKEGNVYNIGARFGPSSSHVFTVTKNPGNNSDSNSAWEQTSIVGEVACTDPMNPTYMHSFGMSENYMVMFESPVRFSIKKFLMRNVLSLTFQDCLYWDFSKNVNVFILNKNTGEKQPMKYTVDPFFTFHHANTFEKDGCLVVDYCRIEESGNFDALLIENMKTGVFKKNPKFLPFLSRLIIPLEVSKNAKVGDSLLKNLPWAKGCTAILRNDGSIHLKEKLLCQTSMEFPRYHTEKVNLKEYSYCYGSTVFGDSDSDDLVGVVKANVQTTETIIWRRENSNQICGEPIFVADPNGKLEDDGCLIVPIMTLDPSEHPFVIILNARDLKEMGRFRIPEERIPLGFHALYMSRNGL